LVEKQFKFTGPWNIEQNWVRDFLWVRAAVTDFVVLPALI